MNYNEVLDGREYVGLILMGLSDALVRFPRRLFHSNHTIIVSYKACHPTRTYLVDS